MFGLFFCLFVTPVLPVQSPRDVSADQTGNAAAWQFTWGPLQWKQLCWKRSCTSVCVCFSRFFIKNSSAWPVAAFTHRNVNIAFFFFLFFFQCLFLDPGWGMSPVSLQARQEPLTVTAWRRLWHRVRSEAWPHAYVENGVTPRARAWLLFVPWPLTDSCLRSIIINFHPTFQSRGLSGSVGRGGRISLEAEKRDNGDFFFFCLLLLARRCSRLITTAVKGGL